MRELVTVPSLRSASADIPSGIVVFLVALPLCLGIALASGAPLFSGVIAGIVGGVIVTLFSGSELSVSGPAAGLASIVATAIVTLGDYRVFLVAVVVAGALQILISTARGGTLGNFIPHCVIKGMLAAIGITIVLKQIPHAVGYAAQFIDEEVFLNAAPWINVLLNPAQSLRNSVVNPGAIVIAATCLGILLLWETSTIKASRWSGIVPGALVAVLAGTLINLLFGIVLPDWALSAERQQLVAIPVLESLSSVASLLVMPDFGAITRTDVWGIAITIALVASIETVLSVEATDKMDPQRRISDVNRELRAQGIGNLTSGLIGGLPITAVIVRSSANVYSGAKTRTSSFVHGLLLLLAVLLIPVLLNQIPLAALASVLLMVGYKLSSLKLIKSVWKEGAAQFIPFIVTVVVVVATDILVGVGVGLLVSVFFLMRAYHRAAMTLAHDGDNYLLRFNKDMSFVNKSKLKETLRLVPDNSHLIVDGIKALYIDHDIYETMQDFELAAKQRGISTEYLHYHGKESARHGRLSPAAS